MYKDIVLICVKHAIIILCKYNYINKCNLSGRFFFFFFKK